VPFVVPGESLHAELELFVAAGVPRPRALRAATADAWRFLGQPHEAGVIEPGARADVLLLPIDPTHAALPLVPDGVMVRGRPRSLSAPLPAGGFLIAPAMAGILQLADRLTDLRPGAKRTLAALEVTFFPAIGLAPVRYQIERKPDAAGRRIFAVTATRGTAATTSELALDARGVAQLTAGPEVTTRLLPAP